MAYTVIDWDAFGSLSPNQKGQLKILDAAIGVVDAAAVQEFTNSNDNGWDVVMRSRLNEMAGCVTSGATYTHRTFANDGSISGVSVAVIVALNQLSTELAARNP